MTPADVIRSVVAEYNTYTPDEIAHKLAAEGMMWCDRNPRVDRSTNCPMHHLFITRLQAAGVEPDPRDITVYGSSAWVSWRLGRGVSAIIDYGPISPITEFIRAFDRYDYDHLESGP